MDDLALKDMLVAGRYKLQHRVGSGAFGQIKFVLVLIFFQEKYIRVSLEFVSQYNFYSYQYSERFHCCSETRANQFEVSAAWL